MILTYTPNPSLDLLYEAGRLVWDDANRVEAPRRRPGGQGINVTRAARALGGESTAIGVLGGRVGDELERMLTSEATPFIRISIDQETRTFVGTRELETGRSLLLNPRGPRIPEQDVDRIIEDSLRAIQSVKAEWVAVCGSIPPGLPLDIYERIGRVARSAGCRFVPDCDGEQLRLAAQHAHLLVPNQHEAERLLNRSLKDIEASAQGARELVRQGPEVVAVTLGSAGAVLSDGKTTWHAEPPNLNRGSAVGAGDAFLAALIISRSQNRPLDEVARRAVAAGTAVLNGTGSGLLAVSEFDRVLERVKVRQLG